MPMLTTEQFAERVKPIEAKLRAYARTFAFTQDAVEDLVQDVKVIALTKLASYDPTTGQDGLLAWLKSILTNLGLRYRKQMAQHSELPWSNLTTDDNGYSAEMQIEYALAEREAEQDWEEERELRREDELGRSALIYRLVDLTDLQRKCMDARLAGEEQAVTAKRLDISQSMVSQHVKAALKKLRK